MAHVEMTQEEWDDFVCDSMNHYQKRINAPCDMEQAMFNEAKCRRWIKQTDLEKARECRKKNQATQAFSNQAVLNTFCWYECAIRELEEKLQKSEKILKKLEVNHA